MNFNQNARKEPFDCQRQSAILWMGQHPEIFGSIQSEQAVLELLSQDPELGAAYRSLSEGLREEFLNFCMGVRGMKVTYDPVFKAIFNPEERPERLEEFLSLCLGEKLHILQVLPNESKRLTEEGSLLVMDILVRLESGALVNVEIQRIGYLFPGARCACYSSDLVMRQYSHVREARRQEGVRFSYHDIKKVYTIVLIQKSTSGFHLLPGEYLHYSKQTFNTGLELDLLQEYLLIPLDIFLKNLHNISSKLDAWLCFIASDRPQDIRNILEAYPEFAELYREVFAFRFQKKELVSMYSDALRILDANTTQYMIEIQQDEINQLKKEWEEKQEQLEEMQEQLEETKEQLEEKQGQLEEKQELLEEKQELLEETQELLEETQEQLTESLRLQKEQEEEIRRLKELLDGK